MTVAASLLACDGGPTPTIQPDTEALIPEPTPTSEAAKTPMRTLEPIGTPAPSPTGAPVPASTATAAAEPMVRLVLEADATVGGYWSDGTANLDITASVRNEGDLGLSDPVQIAVTCTRDGEVLGGCSGEMSVTLADGYGPARDGITLRVPPGSVSLAFAYGESEPMVLGVAVPERIVGVDGDVWECFSDVKGDWPWSTLSTGGCAGWESKTIQKYDQSRAVKVWASGPDSYIGVFGEVLNDLGELLGLEFKGVSTEDEADFVAEIGYRLEGGAYYCSPNEAGCATIDASNEMGELEGSKVRVKDTWDGTVFADLPESSQDFLVHVFAHEGIHALSGMGHRTEPASIMNIGTRSSYTGASTLQGITVSPMDERLLRLHGNPLVKPGMEMAEIEALIVFNDELIDPQTDHVLTKWKLISGAYEALREAGSAVFRVRSSLPDCNEEFGWADYAVSHLGNRLFRWVVIDDGDNHLYNLDGEYWRRGRDGWNQTYGHGEAGWRSEQTDPHAMLENVLLYADWTEADLVIAPNGRARLEFELDSRPGGGLDVVLVLDPETGMVAEYVMDWERGDKKCGRYVVEAKDGRSGGEFDIPDEAAVLLGSCGIEQLGPIDRVVSLWGEWKPHCGSENHGHRRSYSFSVDKWSYVRVESSSVNAVSLQLMESEGNSELVTDQEATKNLSTGNEFIWQSWAQAIVPPGRYIVAVVTQDAILEEFGLLISVSETHGPPHGFESISSGKSHLCALDADGRALCWGDNGELYAGPPYGEVSIAAPPDDRLTVVSSGAYFSCGLRTDGTAACWGRDAHGQISPPAGERFVDISVGTSHACALREDGGATCWGWNYEGQASPPLDERFTTISSGDRFTCALRSDGSRSAGEEKGTREGYRRRKGRR